MTPADPPADASQENLPSLVAAPAQARQQDPPAPWSVADFGYFLAFAAAWMLVSNFLMFLGYAASRPLFGWRDLPVALPTNAFFALVSQMLYYGPLLAYMYYLVVRRYRLRFWAGLSWRTPTARRALQYFAAGLCLGVAVLFAPNLLPSRDDFPLRKLFSSPGAAYAIALFAVLVAPLIEELIFRGVLFSFFERLVGLWFAIVATALLFAGLHVPEYWGAWNGLLLVSLTGGVFSVARGLTGSLAPSVILHLAYNASLMVSLFYNTRHFHSLGAAVLP